MNSCLNNIVSISDPCNDAKVASLSGFDLMDAPEITVGNLAAMATETYISGLNLAKRKLELSIIQVSNDFFAALRSGKFAGNLDATVYDTSTFVTGNSTGNYAGERGVIIYKSSKIRSKLRKLKVTNVQVYPLQDAEGVYLSIYDGLGNTERVSRYQVDLVANQLNNFELNYEVQGSYVRVVFDNSSLAFASSPTTCFEGCHGELPNPCGYTRGWDGRKETKKGDSFGINVQFQCFCDYNALLCSMAKTYIGEIVWLKARINLLDEHLRSNRFNNWIIYNTEETKKHKQELETEYVGRWNALVGSLANILTSHRDECVICNGIQWRPNG